MGCAPTARARQTKPYGLMTSSEKAIVDRAINEDLAKENNDVNAKNDTYRRPSIHGGRDVFKIN